VVDSEAPVIILLGDASITVREGDVFNDLSANATDDVDGDLSANIVVSNPVNIDQPDVYQITYNVSDAAGNAATQVIREVTVLANHIPTVSGIPLSEVILGSGYRFELQALDLDGDALTMSISNLPDWASFDSATGILQGTPLSAQHVGVYEGIVITVSDGRDTVVLGPFTVTVSNVITAVDNGNGGGITPPITTPPSSSGESGGGGSLAWSWLLMLWLLACRVGIESCRRAL